MDFVESVLDVANSLILYIIHKGIQLFLLLILIQTLCYVIYLLMIDETYVISFIFEFTIILLYNFAISLEY